MWRRALCLALLLLLIAPVALGHGGRTDSQGGHHDYDNVSGLGYYHYHHGMEAHLHPGGVCPYDNDNSGSDTPHLDAARRQQEAEAAAEQARQEAAARHAAEEEAAAAAERRERTIITSALVAIGGVTFVWGAVKRKREKN